MRLDIFTLQTQINPCLSVAERRRGRCAPARVAAAPLVPRVRRGGVAVPGVGGSDGPAAPLLRPQLSRFPGAAVGRGGSFWSVRNSNYGFFSALCCLSPPLPLNFLILM